MKKRLWPTIFLTAFIGCAGSGAYREAREHRFRGADYRAVLVEGV